MGYKVSPYVTHSARVPSGLGKRKNVKTKAIACKCTENTEALSTESASAPAPIQHAVRTVLDYHRPTTGHGPMEQEVEDYKTCHSRKTRTGLPETERSLVG